MNRGLSVLAGLSLLALLVVPGSCASQEETSGVSGQSGAGGDSGQGVSGESGAGGEELGGWVPMEGWTGQLPVVDAGQATADCGPGCRLVFPVQVKQRNLYEHGYDDQGVFDKVFWQGTSQNLFFCDYNSSELRVASPPSGTQAGFSIPSRWSKLLALNLYKYPEGRIQVLDLNLGLQRTFFHYVQDKDTEKMDFGVVHTLVNNKYVFWIHASNGLYRADLQTGETTHLLRAPLVCDRLCALSSGVICSVHPTQVLFIDQETGEPSALNATNYLQTGGACSPDRSQVAWIDYRDYPGTLSTGDAFRGGEVYLHDLATHKTRRVTFDSPSAPRQKIYPSVHGERVIWSEMPEENLNPTWASALYGGANVLVYLNLTTGKKCRLPGRGGSRSSLHGHHLYTYWVDTTVNELYLTEVDLEHPDLPWVCE